jgi:hypothetical protein
MEYTTRKGKKLFDPASLRTKGGRQTVIYDIMPRLRILPKPSEERKRSRPGPGTRTDQSVKRAREDRDRGRIRRQISVENEREMARDEMRVQPKHRKKKERRETMKFSRPVKEGRRRHGKRRSRR